MTHVVTQACIGCKDTSCADACPCESFHEGPEMLYINPDSCIDCEACVVECPTDAISSDDSLEAHQIADLELNARMSQVFPVISERRIK